MVQKETVFPQRMICIPASTCGCGTSLRAPWSTSIPWSNLFTKRFALLFLPLIPLTMAADPQPPVDKPAAKTVKVTKGLCKVEVSLNGVLAAGDMTEIRFSPKAWTGPFTIRKVTEHGSAVKKGDVLVELDPEKFDQALRDLETEQRVSELSIQLAQAELPVLEKLMPIELAEAERLKKQA